MTPAVLHVRGGLGEALSEPVLRTLEGEPLALFLSGRRWFGAKGRTPKQVRVKDVVPLFRDGIESAVARLDVDLGGAGVLTYQLPLAVKEGDPAGITATVARVEDGSRKGILFDAVEDPGFRRRLGQAFDSGAAFGGSGTKWLVGLLSGEKHPALGEVEARLGAAEQSNTSIRYGDRAILKIYRRLAPGQNPDVEIPEFLTRRSFPHVPPLFGKIEFQEVDGARMLAGVVQQFVPNRGDGWTHALERFDEELLGSAPSASGTFRDDAARIGAITRALHEALASDATHPDFAPIPASREDVQMWRDRVRLQVATATDLLAERTASGGLPEAVAPLAAHCLGRRAEVMALLERIVAAVEGGAGARIRHHGDYHLGQVLVTVGGDFMVVDFEGEPARPLEERRQRHSALRDVAGMLRSFAYAAAAGMRRRDAAERAKLEARALAWEQEARAAFLAAYLGAGGKAAFLPAAGAATEALVTLFEIEKVFYEVAYELNNRPDWAAIPLRGIERLIRAESRAPTHVL